MIRGEARQHGAHAEVEPTGGFHAADARIDHRVAGEPFLPRIETPASFDTGGEFLPQSVIGPHEVAELDARLVLELLHEVTVPAQTRPETLQ